MTTDTYASSVVGERIRELYREFRLPTLAIEEDGTSTPDRATVDLNVGANLIKATVTAPDGTTVANYTVTVTRAASDDATLSGLELEYDGTAVALTPVFDPATTVYTASVGNAVDAITLTATKSHSGASVAIIEEDGTSTPDQAAVDLNVGANLVKAAVTAPDGTTVTNYTVTVTRAASDDATLSGLGLEDDGTAVALTPAFDPATTVYTASVGNAVDAITLTATKNHSGASVAIIEEDGTSTPDQATVDLDVDDNRIIATVTAEDGTTTENYRVTVTRAASDDATLSALALADSDGNPIALTPSFASSTTVYTASVANSVDTATLTTAKNHAGASVAVIEVDGTSTPDQATVGIDVGDNLLKAEVTAEDGTTVKTYNITVTRAAPTTTTLWTATLTVGTDNAVVPAPSGYSLWGNVSGALSAESFTLDGESYTVQLLAYFADGLYFGLNRELPSDFTLLIGDAEYAASDSSVPTTAARAEYWWGNKTFSWPGQSVEVSLVMDQDSVSPLPQRQAAPPAASFESVPASHNGVDAFTFRTKFSEHIPMSFKTLKKHSFQVSGGSVIKAKRATKGSNRNWNITVRPESSADVVITLISASDCETVGAICASDGRGLYNQATVTVPGP